MRLIPAELAGYLLTVVPLALAGATLLPAQGGLRMVVTLAAAVWVAILAVRLWRVPDAVSDGASVDARALFVTTALNPKALIFGLVLLPSPDRLAENLLLFAGLVALVAVLWGGIGAVIRAGGTHQPRALFVLRRLASVWLAMISRTCAHAADSSFRVGAGPKSLNRCSPSSDTAGLAALTGALPGWTPCLMSASLTSWRKVATGVTTPSCRRRTARRLLRSL